MYSANNSFTIMAPRNGEIRVRDEHIGTEMTGIRGPLQQVLPIRRILAGVMCLALASSAVRGEEMRVFYDFLEHSKLQGGRLTVNTIDPAARAAFGLDAVLTGTTWPSTTIQNNGPPSNRIDIVLLGDGYTAGEHAAYTNHVSTVVNGFFAQEPLAAYRTYFNAHRVDVESNESGVDEIDLGIFRDTALDMAYGCFGIDRLLCIDVGKAYNAAASAPAFEQILALANSTRYGGAGYPDNEIGTLAGNNGAAIEIALHEFGHAFADLADEYDYADGATYSGPEPIEPNVSIFNAAAQVAQQRKWWRWMNLANVDTFQGAYYNQFGIYRPTNNSKMRSLDRPFEQVNVEQFVVSMYKIVSPIDAATPASGAPLSPCTVFFVDPLDPIDHALNVLWHLDGAVVIGANGLTFTPQDFNPSPGGHQISVTVTDTTTRVRDEALRTQWMTETRAWPIFVPGPYGDLVVNGIIDVDDISCSLSEFVNNGACLGADIAPCGGNGVVDVDDIQAVLSTFVGNPPCPDPDPCD